MLHVTRSELVRMARPRMLGAWFALMSLFAVMINAVMFATVGDSTGLPDGGPGVAFPTETTLASAEGIVAGLSAAASMFGVVILSFWAVTAATDYSSGLIRLLASAEPRRWRLLAGKVGALLVVTAAATAIATIVNITVAAPLAEGAGLSVEPWRTGLVGTVATAYLNTFLALAVWGALGLALAVLARSSALAISVGVGYVLVVEGVLRAAAPAATDWLPGSTLTALAAGGNATLSYGAAMGLGLTYAGIALGLATVVLTRRDITD